ncbi:MAG: alpha/beta hydrolase [Leptonema illini]|uniref:Maspardin n=1 Tax=Leptonema illini TaxID=183 RepID=A0A833H3Y9_9LEPT|nr:MAG: alpha/beta hydrolase [Leptonema illini]
MKRLKKILYIIAAAFALFVAALYNLPSSMREAASFADFSQQVAPETIAAYNAFRERPVKRLERNGQVWIYRKEGSGPGLLLLHGMGGEADLWWQQIERYEKHFTVIAPTYPPVRTLHGLSEGIIDILDAENIDRTIVMGTSLGGYLTQYLLAQHPQRFERAALLNTFPPNTIIAEQNRLQGWALRLLPEPVVFSVYRTGLEKRVLPASQNSPLLRAHLMTLASGGMTKEQLYARYLCVMESFQPAAPFIPMLIVDSDNDPLVSEQLREMLVGTYPQAKRVTLHEAGHFPYLSHSDQFHSVIDEFLYGHSHAAPISSPIPSPRMSP